MPIKPCTPFISVVCPTYQSGSYIKPTLESLFNQTYPHYELIFSDDGSTDDTCTVIRDHANKSTQVPVTILDNPHLGPGAARNAGITQARGEWIAFIDSDDRWKANKLARVAQVITQHPERNLICHNLRYLRDREHSVFDYGAWFDPDKPLLKQLFYRCLFTTSAVTCKKSLLEEAKGFNETLMSGQDYELWLRLAPKLRPYFLREVLGDYCYRSGNITSKHLIKRWCNLVRILYLHRQQVTGVWMLYCLFHHSGGFIKQRLRIGG